MVIAFIFVSLDWVRTLKAETTIPVPPGFLESDIGMRCIDDDQQNSVLTNAPTEFIPQKCKSGLICSKADPSDNFGVCLKDLGITCRTLDECVAEAKFCVGVCTKVLSGGVNQPCSRLNDECGPNGNTCVLTNGDYGVCKANDGKFCTTDDQCLGNYCENGVCKSRKINGEKCLNDADCLSNICTVDLNDFPTGKDALDMSGNVQGAAYCQPSLEIVSGMIGYACDSYLIDQGPKCNETDALGDVLGCARDGILERYGTCQPTDTSWPNNGCDKNTSCLVPSLCIDGECVLPEDVNSCSIGTTGVCIEGYQCVDGDCRAITNGVPEEGGNRFGFARWFNATDSQESIGDWKPDGFPNITSIGNGAELFSLDYGNVNKGTLHFIGGRQNTQMAPNNINNILFYAYRSDPGGFQRVTVNLYYIFRNINGTMANPRQYTKETNGTTTTEFFVDLNIRVISVRLTSENQLFIYFSYVSFNENNLSLSRTYYRTYLADLPISIYEAGVSNVNIEVEHICTSRQQVISGTRYTVNLPTIKEFITGGLVLNDVEDVWCDTRIVNDTNDAIITAKSPDEIRDGIININAMNSTILGISVDVNFYSRGISPFLPTDIARFPYLVGKLTNYIDNNLNRTTLYVQSNITIGESIEIKSTNIPPYNFNTGNNAVKDNIVNYSLYYNVGALPQQINIAYIEKSLSNEYNLRYCSSGLNRSLPGHYDSESRVAVSSRYIGNDPRYRVIESEWNAHVYVVTRVLG